MIITIDGPAGAGKSSVARALARRLGFRFLDTGAMYRAVALAGMRRGLDWDVPDDLARLARKLDLQVVGDRILARWRGRYRGRADLGGNRRDPLRGRQSARAGSIWSSFSGRWPADDNVVTEGRDQGTVAFPDAACKIFLTASPEERARRRWRDLQLQGEPVTLDQVLAAQERRDREDASRAVGPLMPAPDAVEVRTDGLTLEEVVDRLEELVESEMPKTKIKHDAASTAVSQLSAIRLMLLRLIPLRHVSTFSAQPRVV